MFYVKNLPTWERAVRFVAALAMIFCGVHFYGQPAGWAFFALGAVSLVTGAVGFCPACAVAGRRIAVRARQAQ